MTLKPNKTALFFRKSVDVLLRGGGFKGFDAGVDANRDWCAQREWTVEQKEGFRKWFVANSRKDLKGLADREFALFNLMWGWRNGRKDAGKGSS
jgi:hypothetical protein